jgi:thymidylate synthase
MKTLPVRNVCDALVTGVYNLYQKGIVEASRNGVVLACDTPVTTIYAAPQERVLFSPTRDANPFFHLMEAIWIMGGRRDLEWPMYFNKRFSEFSDDGKLVRGSAYGYRWQQWFGYNQLNVLLDELTKNPNSRRGVLTMWSAQRSLSDPHAAILGSRDVPCNTHAYVTIRQGKLDLTVCNRSNDIWWGAYGANAVHFSILQEWLAAMLKVQVGLYYQISNNYHLYRNVVTEQKALDLYMEYTNGVGNPYVHENLEAQPLFSGKEDPALFPIECCSFCSDPETALQTPYNFLRLTAYPMFKAWQARKESASTGLEWVSKIAAPDWRRACLEWINRRMFNKEKLQ